MHKITKGLKKKKKGKKSKHKDDDLFKPEELEAYRREHQQQSSTTAADETCSTEKPATSGENEEWKKFIALTSGVDDILKKTQGDLDRIKSTSFFQRVPPPSEVRKQEEEKEAEERAEQELKEQEEAAEKRIVAEAESHIVEVSESESGEEDEDDIFDTTYIDALAAGDVKLAYIPESPTDEPDDDPFDTTYAEKAILGPNAERKGKKLVPLGSAVEILTGRVQAPTCASIKRPSPRRQVLKEKNLLLTSFDESTQDTAADDTAVQVPQATLLDDDAPSELVNEPIDLNKSLAPVAPVKKEEPVVVEDQTQQSIVDEFDVLNQSESPLEDDDDKEFALLAAESLSKAPVVSQAVVSSLPPDVVPQPSNESWNAFGQEKHANDVDDENAELDDDPFDTTFAENILPGQAELKIIEKEILENDTDFDFNPRADEAYAELLRTTQVSIQITNPSGQRESVSSLERISEDELNSIKPIHRDLLGGSNTDLSQLGDQPLQPKESNQDEEEEEIIYSDPFDTSSVDIAKLPGTTELKFLEKELLGDDIVVKPTPAPVVIEDDDFDPRAFDNNNKNANQLRKVSFDLPLDPKPDLLGLGDDDAKSHKPLTPYYVRENSIPEQKQQPSNDIDPFDTSFVSDIGPGEVELQLIEDELINQSHVTDTLDNDFNPRDEKQVALAKVVETIKSISDGSLVVEQQQQVVEAKQEPLDLLGIDNELEAKVLTPALEPDDECCVANFDDPFDTSIASNLLPGTAELKLLETELINSDSNIVVQQQPIATIKRVLTDPEFDPRITDTTTKVDLLEQPSVDTVKPLTPLVGRASFDLCDDKDEDFDPFDTSIANNIAPGPSELKLLESELI